MLSVVFRVWGPLLSWSASAACCVELSCGVLWSKADFINDIVRMSGNVCEVIDSSSFNGFRQVFRIDVLVDPRVARGSVDVCGLDLHCPTK